MTYTQLPKEVEKLSYRDKFRLAQLLIQLARKEEEEQNPERRESKQGGSAELEPELVQYVADRLRRAGSPRATRNKSLWRCRRVAIFLLARMVALPIQRSDKSMRAPCEHASV